MDTVDYLSLDIEGSEYKVLQAAFENRNDWKFNVATIETTIAVYKYSILDIINT